MTYDAGYPCCAEYGQMKAEIERLRKEVETWRDRYTAERQAHEATMDHFDRICDERY